MIKPPDSAHWDTSRLSRERQDYLEAGCSFEEIAARVTSSAEIIGAKIEPYDTAPDHEKDGRQVIFAVRLRPELSDLLYNSREGLRARYWQSPYYGFLANRYVIDFLAPELLSFSERNEPELIRRSGRKTERMTLMDIELSLSGILAKIWPREYNDSKSNDLLVDDRLLVRRWVENENEIHGTPGKWRKSPRDFGEWEIKGALLGLDTTEYIPESKRDRSYQIFRYGFS